MFFFFFIIPQYELILRIAGLDISLYIQFFRCIFQFRGMVKKNRAKIKIISRHISVI